MVSLVGSPMTAVDSAVVGLSQIQLLGGIASTCFRAGCRMMRVLTSVASLGVIHNLGRPTKHTKMIKNDHLSRDQHRSLWYHYGQIHTQRAWKVER